LESWRTGRRDKQRQPMIGTGARIRRRQGAMADSEAGRRRRATTAKTFNFIFWPICCSFCHIC
jgi:hypothetical protein